MRCYKCNAVLSEKSYCTGCGADVSVYKKIISLSNLYYNDGLSKANVRDLSGAVVSLKRSLKYNKRNSAARNLLGLVYFEMGEMASALGQWIISTNFRPKKNIAEDYMKTLSSNQGKFAAMTQTIHKYNLSLDYCRHDSHDLAVIQLKKLLSVNTNLLQGHQLLALLYIRSGENDKAIRQLQAALKIDAGNTMTLHLLNEVNGSSTSHISKHALRSDEGVELLRKSKDTVEFRSGNEMIIQPANIKENNGLWTILNIVIGLVVGAAVTYFLIVPAQNQVTKSKYKTIENQSYEQLQEKNAEIDSLNAQIGQLQAAIDSTNAQLAGYEGDSGVVTALVNLSEAERIYISGDIGASFAVLVTVNRDVLPDTAKVAWQTLYDASMQQILREAETQYKHRNNPDAAINYYQQVLTVDGTNEEAIYNCAEAYKKKGSKDEALQMYNTYLQTYPSGRYAAAAQRSVTELQRQ